MNIWKHLPKAVLLPVPICSTQFVLAARGIALSDNYPLSGPVRKLINELQVYHYQDTEKIPDIR